MADERKIIYLEINATKAVDGSSAATRALEKIERQTASMGSGLERIEASLGRVGGYLKTQLALYVAEAGARLLEMGKQAFEAAAGMGELAEKVGLTARQLQGLQFIGVQNGASLDDITTAAAKFSVKMGEAAEGSKDTIEALKRLGVQNLDLQGHLRPTADQMTEVARAILAIEDPARRSANMVAFFGKSGTTMTASLQEISKGLGAAATDAQHFGAMIGDDAIQRLDQFGDSLERGKLRARAFLAEGLAAILDWMDRNKEALLGFGNTLTFGLVGVLANIDNYKKSFDKLGTFLGDALDSMRSDIDGFVVGLADGIAKIPRLIGNMAVGAMNATVEAIEAGINRAIFALNQFGANNPAAWSRLGLGTSDISPVNMGRITPFGPAPSVNANGSLTRDYAGERAQARTLARQAAGESAETAARRGAADMPANLLTGLNSKGGGLSPVTGEGQSEAEHIQKLKDTLTAAADAQDQMSAAARRGDVAFQEQQAHAEALQKAIEVYAGKLDAANPKVASLAAEIENLILRTKEGAAAQAFVVATTELEKQNTLLDAQLQLMNEAPEVQARELALIKSKQDAQKAGNQLTAEDVENRRAAIEQNERLKIQAEQMKQANELWTEPLKQAFRNIQTAGADAWEHILETGQITFQSLGEVFTKTLRRMAAEFLALATIRPVMQLAVEAIGPGGIGLIGGNTASQLGFPVGPGGGGLGSMMSGGGIGNLFSSGGATGGGWLARQFGGIGSFLNSPLYSMGGNPLASGAFGPTAPGLFNGSVSIGGALGGLGSIGMGAYGLLSGKGGAANTIGSIGQIAGGAMMMIPGLQPFGAGLSILSSIIPGLFGSGLQIPKQPPLAYGMGNFYATGGTSYMNGSGALNGGTGLDGGPLGSAVMGYLRSAGLSPVAGKLIGGELASGVDHQLNGNQWSDRPYTQIGLVHPGGGLERLTYNDSSRNAQQAGEMLVAQVVRANVLRGGVSGAGAGLTAGLDKLNPTTQADLENVIAMGTAYDRLGKAQNTVKDAIDKLGGSFEELRDFATKAGLSLDPINAELEKQTRRTAQDFIDNMLDPLAVQLRALDDERASALESAQYIKDNVSGVFVDMAKVAEFYTNKEAALRDQFYQGGVSNLENLIKRLTYGDLANASPDTSLAGTRSAYTDTLARARAGDSTAISNLAGLAETYTTTARNYYGSATSYVAVQEQVRRDLQDAVAVATGGAASGPGAALQINQAVQAQIANTDRQAEIIDQLGQQVSDLKNMVSNLTRQLQSNTTNRR